MTAIPAVDSTSANSANTLSRTTLADNFDTFLTLLTAQLQNQDPLSPMDSNQFTQQLVQFSQVEQQIRTNEQLDSILLQNRAASAGTALSYLGRDAILQSSATSFAENDDATWAYALPEQADTVRLEVRDARGVTIYSTTGDRGQGDHAFTWDGRMTNGQTAPAGVYTLAVTARDEANEAITPTITIRERIVGLDLVSSSPQVITSSGAHELSSIRAILNDD